MHKIHASRTSAEFPVADRISDINLTYWFSSQHLPQHDLHHQHKPWNSGTSQGITEVTDSTRISISNRSNGVHHDYWSQHAALTSAYLQDAVRITVINSSPAAANNTSLIMYLGSSTYHGLHNRFFWLFVKDIMQLFNDHTDYECQHGYQ